MMLMGGEGLRAGVAAFQPLLDPHAGSGHTQACKIASLPAVQDCVWLCLPSPWKYLKTRAVLKEGAWSRFS